MCLQGGSKQPAFSIHNENRYASGQTKRPRGPRSTLSLVTTGINNSPMLLNPRFDLETRALAYYLHFQLQTLTNVSSVCNGLADCIAIWASGSNCYMVELGITTLALGIFSNVHRDSPAAATASGKYEKLLGIVRQTVPTLSEKNVDSCLLAIFTMARYEATMYDDISGNVSSCKSLSHHDGARAVLKLWKNGLSQKMAATEVIKHTRRGLIRSALLKGSPIPKWMQNGHDFGERGRELAFDQIMVQLLNLRHELSLLYRRYNNAHGLSTDNVTPRALELFDELRDIDSALQDWKAHFPRGWTYRTTHSDSELLGIRTDITPWTIYSYTSPVHAWTWNQYITTCMLIDSTRIRILDICQNPGGDEYSRTEQLKQCVSRIHAMGDQLAANIPYCLQRFKPTSGRTNEENEQDHIWYGPDRKIKPYAANQLIWPVGIAAGISNMDPKQRGWFKSMLGALGRITGLGVIACADTNNWLEL